jgi:polyisoprenoid-binding protein YceI
MRHPLAAAILALGLIAPPLAVSAAPSSDPAAMPAGTYVVDPHHASIVGHVNHFGTSNYAFRFDRFDASYAYDPAAPDAAKVTVSIDLASMDTGWDVADKAFPGEFLGLAKAPTATFVSTSITHTGASGVVNGLLTLNGVTRPVALATTFNGYGKLGPLGALGTKAGFTASATIKRSDFGLTKYLGMVGDDVTLDINAEFVAKR